MHNVNINYMASPEAIESAAKSVLEFPCVLSAAELSESRKQTAGDSPSEKVRSCKKDAW